MGISEIWKYNNHWRSYRHFGSIQGMSPNFGSTKNQKPNLNCGWKLFKPVSSQRTFSTNLYFGFFLNSHRRLQTRIRSSRIEWRERILTVRKPLESVTIRC
jgi:hypothetical protein